MERIDRHRCFLQERIDPDNGFLMKLRSFLLPIEDINAIKSRSTFIERNDKIIDVILQRREYVAFLGALSETAQQHLVNYLKADGENLENIDDWPLTNRETKLIDTNYDVLARKLDADGLVGELFSRKAITMEQMQTIKCKPTDLERNDALLEILRRKSLRDYSVMISVLRESYCDHSANILEGVEKSSPGLSSTEPPGELLSTELFWSLETGTKHSIWGIAYLDNLIYVLKKQNKLLLAFEDKVPFSPSKEILITQVAVPRDLAACPTHNCLYVVDDGRKCIWKIPCPSFQVVQWLTGNGNPFKISVNESGRVLIPREGKPCVIELIGSDATLEKTIELPGEIKDLEYALQSPSGTFVVSYGKNKSRNRGILEVSMEGQILRTQFLQTSEMRDPRHMTFGRGDRLFVTDCRNDRVIAFDSQLRMKQVVLNKLKNSISMPYRVCYIEDKKYLIVVHSFGYKVVVYTCS